MNIALCEDNEIERKILSDILISYFVKKHIHYIIEEYENSENLIFDFENGSSPDIIFMDIYMPGITGIAAARTLREQGCNSEILFITGTKEYAIEGYEVDARGYLLKPYDIRKITDALNRVLKNSGISTYSINIRSNIVRIPLYEITYIESCNSKCVIHCVGDILYPVYKKLTDIEKDLNDSRFLRCHQSYLVNMDYVKIANKNFELITGDAVGIRQRDLHMIKQKYYDYFSKH